MKAEDKLEEGRYFLSRMEANRGDDRIFRYYLSAFLTASRSVVMYLESELGGFPEFRSWVKYAVYSDKLMEFFRRGRDYVVHRPRLAGSGATIAVGEQSAIHLGMPIAVRSTLSGSEVGHTGPDSGEMAVGLTPTETPAGPEWYEWLFVVGGKEVCPANDCDRPDCVDHSCLRVSVLGLSRRYVARLGNVVRRCRAGEWRTTV